MKIFVISIIFLLSQTCDSVKLDRAILSTNDHLYYYPFWPMVANGWQKMGIRPTLALIAEDDFEIDESLGDVIRFKPIEGVPTWFHAQVIRLFLPLWFPDDVCITSDIDMLPISKQFFQGSIEKYDSDKFIIYRDKAYNNPQACRFPICYFAGKGSVFKEILGGISKDDVEATIKEWFSWNLGWETDERVFSCLITKWNGYSNRCIKLGYDAEGMLSRLEWKIDPDKLSQYYQAHMPKPYSQYKKEIDYLLDCLEKIN